MVEWCNELYRSRKMFGVVEEKFSLFETLFDQCILCAIQPFYRRFQIAYATMDELGAATTGTLCKIIFPLVKV